MNTLIISSTTAALDIPEIAEIIVSFLSLDSLTRCLCVSHQWHRCFLPTIWKDCQWSRPNRHFENETALIKHAHLIQSFSTTNFFLCQELLSPASTSSAREQKEELGRRLVLPNLHTLRFEALNSVKSAANGIPPHVHFSWDATMDLVRRHAPLLQTLIVKDYAFFYKLDDYVPPAVARLTDTATPEWLSKPPSSVTTTGKATTASPPPIKTKFSRLSTLSISKTFVDLTMMSDQGWELLRQIHTLILDNADIPGALENSTTDLHRDDHILENLFTLKENLAQRTKIQHLTILQARRWEASNLKGEFALIASCRQLQSLRWRNLRQRNGPPWNVPPWAPPLARCLSEGYWPYLNSLDLSLQPFTDRDLAELLYALSAPDRFGLRELLLDDTAFGSLSFEALLYRQDPNQPARPQPPPISVGWRNCPSVTYITFHDKGEPISIHQQILEVLSLLNVTQLLSPMIQDILCSCSRLKTFRSSSFFSDLSLLHDPRPWSCQDSLQTLQVYLITYYRLPRRVYAHTIFPSVSEAFLKKLSELRNLETLIMGQDSLMDGYVARARGGGTHDEADEDFPVLPPVYIPHIDDQRHYAQSYILKEGLEHLKPLKKIRRLCPGVHGKPIGLEEAEWMMAHWPGLESINLESMTYRDPLVLEVVKSFFKKHGVRTK
ncbi:hypothetical protein BGZ83_010289 [Gryganskiella cystojenkinii]|nr:hypothetical protein BGZ83_010289 [Gryganskiella cystojenkinii]